MLLLHVIVFESNFKHHRHFRKTVFRKGRGRGRDGHLGGGGPDPHISKICLDFIQVQTERNIYSKDVRDPTQEMSEFSFNSFGEWLFWAPKGIKCFGRNNLFLKIVKKSENTRF